MRQRARWFDVRDPSRSAGSDGELVAGSYLLARLERAGYVVSLDPVPVGNLLHSTNVIAVPPGGKPSLVVVVDYDTSTSAPSDGTALGTFLEVARALRVRAPRHSVEFAALGAEHTSVNGGQVGARSLIEQLKLLEPRPPVLRIGSVSPRGGLSATGPGASAVSEAAAAGGKVRTSGALQHDVFTRAGFSETVVAGGRGIGPLLLGYLTAAVGNG